jgi:hypothetical protein
MNKRVDRFSVEDVGGRKPSPVMGSEEEWITLALGRGRGLEVELEVESNASARRRRRTVPSARPTAR